MEREQGHGGNSSPYNAPVTVAPLLLSLLLAQAKPGAGYEPGQVHPDFHLPRLDGTMGRLSDYRGKRVVLINFASW